MIDNISSKKHDRLAYMLDAWFFAHPRSVGESYLRHLAFTLRYATYLVLIGVGLVVHGLVPRLFPTLASDRICALSRIFEKRRAEAALRKGEPV